MNAVLAEWHKLRSVRSTWWFLIGAGVLTLVVAGLAANDMRVSAVGPIEVTAPAVETVAWTRFVLGSLAMLVITSEYATRTIVVTPACTPSRIRLVAAKTAPAFVAVTVAGVALGSLGTAVSVPVLGPSASPGPLVARLLAIGVTLGLTALLALGLGILIRPRRA